MKYRIVYNIADSRKRKSIETYLAAAGFQPQFPFTSMTATLEISCSEIRRKLKKLRNACLLTQRDSLVLIFENGSRKEELPL